MNDPGGNFGLLISAVLVHQVTLYVYNVCCVVYEA